MCKHAGAVSKLLGVSQQGGLTLKSLTRPHLSRARRANSSPSKAMSAWNLGWHTRMGTTHYLTNYLYTFHSVIIRKETMCLS